MEMERFFSRDGLGQIGSVSIQSLKDFMRDSGPQWAAAIAFYSLLSLFPLLLAAAGIAAYFVDPEWAIQQGTRLMGNFLPGGVEQIRQIVQDTIQARGGVSFFSFLLLIWSGSRVFGVITKALNIAYNADEPYGFLKRTLIELLMTLTIGVLFVLALGSRLLLELIVEELLFLSGNRLIFRAIQWMLPGVLLFVTFYLTYRFVPRKKPAASAAFTGALLAALLFLGGRILFIGYIQKFANYNLVYGPLGIVITLILWAWIAAVILLLGGELVSHIQEMLIEQKSEQEVEASHERRDPTNSKNG